MNGKHFTSGNNFPEGSFKVGGGRSVWYQRGRCIPGGFTVDLTDFPKGSVVSGGTPILYDEATRTAKVHVAVKVYETAAIGDTAIKVEKLLGNSTLTAGQYVMVAPSTVSGTGTGLTIVSVDRSHEGYDVLTVAALEAAITAGTILVEADKAGAGAVIAVVPNALSYYDIYVDSDSTQFTVTAVVEGTVYERRIPPVADAVKSLFNEITFSQSR